ncbi:MAG TPA: tyrosine-type recombinase/integrase, partial [Acidobacteriaceae bacterium]|nr:tyrosine-type recombinase/integrase [Acidobacteriaceae bacterium]
ISEVVGLQVGDIDSHRMLIRIRQGKGKKDRYAMLSPRLLEVLRAWYRSSRMSGRAVAGSSPADWLFPGYRRHKHMNVGSLQTACREAAQIAGLAKRVTVHTLRHSFATHMLENGTDTRVIQALLGHSRIDTTARYAAVSPNAIAKVRSPLDRIGEPARPKGKRSAKTAG